MKKYDLIVIGSGGGTKVSSPAASMGYKTAIIEKEDIGGTCLNRGCIPSKMIIHPANVASMIREAKKYDITAPIKKINFSSIVRRVTKTVVEESKSIIPLYKKKKNLDFYHSHARFVSNNVIEVGGKKITAPKIVIATGSTPAIPPIEGLEGTPYMTSREALRNTKLPKKLIVIGAGYIACELGHAYGALGSKVHFLVRSRLIPREDGDIREEFSKVFAKRHTLHIGFRPKRVSYKNKKFTVISEDGKRITGDALLVATGVRPNTEGLGLENTDIKLTKRGYVNTNRYMQTSVPGVYAIGDVAGKYLFRHSVNFEGEYLLDNIFSRKPKPIRYPPMPHAIFSYPEVAGVGATEEELQEKKVPYIVGKNPYKRSAMGMARLPEHGFVKLLFHTQTHRLLGAHIIGEEAATMVHQLIFAMTKGATLQDLLSMIYIHPALPEIVRNAARNARKQLKK